LSRRYAFATVTVLTSASRRFLAPPSHVRFPDVYHEHYPERGQEMLVQQISVQLDRLGPQARPFLDPSDRILTETHEQDRAAERDENPHARPPEMVHRQGDDGDRTAGVPALTSAIQHSPADGT
jgi:hypothetical protein